jgi:hypothetical protein
MVQITKTIEKIYSKVSLLGWAPANSLAEKNYLAYFAPALNNFDCRKTCYSGSIYFKVYLLGFAPANNLPGTNYLAYFALAYIFAQNKLEWVSILQIFFKEFAAAKNLSKKNDQAYFGPAFIFSQKNVILAIEVLFYFNIFGDDSFLAIYPQGPML